MANKAIKEMLLPASMANVLAARNIHTAKDALSLPEFDLTALLDLPLHRVRDAVAIISQFTCPPCRTALELLKERTESRRYLSTTLPGLDQVLCGGVAFGALTELVGPSGIGKTQFCLKLALLASLPASYGGLNGRVIYIDTESKFSSRRMVEIGEHSFPQVFQTKGMAQEMAGRIVVLRPSTLSDFAESLQQIKVKVLQDDVKLILIDSMAALVVGEGERSARPKKQHSWGWCLSFLKSLVELAQIPLVVTNQVRGRSNDESFSYAFQGHNKSTINNSERFESHLTAALGTQWAHAVTTRLIFEAHSGHRFIKVAKSPISPAIAFPFAIDSSGILLLDDEGFEVAGQDINRISCQGYGMLDEGSGSYFYQ